jgi:hypothetical protein
VALRVCCLVRLLGAAIGDGAGDTPTQVLEEHKDPAAGEIQACCRVELQNLEVIHAAT